MIWAFHKIKNPQSAGEKKPAEAGLPISAGFD
jgi:hypothetical protein